MPDKTKRSGVGQAWLAQRVGVTPYSALSMILLPRKSFFVSSHFRIGSKNLGFIDKAHPNVYLTVVFETTRIYVMLLKFAIYPDWGKVGKANMRQFAGFCLVLGIGSNFC
jgi:hypothetical protein